MKNSLEAMQELFDALNDQNKDLMLWIAKHIHSTRQPPKHEESADHTDLTIPH